MKTSFRTLFLIFCLLNVDLFASVNGVLQEGDSFACIKILSPDLTGSCECSEPTDVMQGRYLEETGVYGRGTLYECEDPNEGQSAASSHLDNLHKRGLLEKLSDLSAYEARYINSNETDQRNSLFVVFDICDVDGKGYSFVTPIFVSGLPKSPYLEGDIGGISKDLVSKGISCNVFQKVSISVPKNESQQQKNLKRQLSDLFGSKALEERAKKIQKVIDDEKKEFEEEIVNAVKEKIPQNLDRDLLYAVEGFNFCQNIILFPLNFNDVFPKTKNISDAIFNSVTSRLLGIETHGFSNLLGSLAIEGSSYKDPLNELRFYFPPSLTFFDEAGNQGIFGTGFSHYFYDSEQAFLSWLDSGERTAFSLDCIDKSLTSNSVRASIFSVRDVCTICRGSLSRVLSSDRFQKNIFEFATNLIKQDDPFSEILSQKDFMLDMFCISIKKYEDKKARKLKRN